MINRHYFMSAEKPHNDGNGSLSFNSFTLSYVSWFPDPIKVYGDGAANISETMSEKPGSVVRITAFNRI